MPSQSKTNNRISIKAIEAYRAKTYKRNGPLTTVDQAIKFVRERGFIFFWPIKDVELPSLWMAVAGDRPVAPEHDDPGHVTWGWKDQMLGERKWYYAKLLRKKATLVSLEVAPYFYALTENYGDPDEDYLIQYEAGRLKHENKRIYEALLGEGPMDAVALRRKVGLTGKGNKYRFDRAVVELQTDMKILPIGVAEAGVWELRHGGGYSLSACSRRVWSGLGVCSSARCTEVVPLRGCNEWREGHSRYICVPTAAGREVQRAFGRLKEYRKLDNLKIRGLAKVELHAILAVLVMQAQALGSCRREERHGKSKSVPHKEIH
ncbi:MAG: hypothetical protein IIA51_08670 [Chloroflexi bacterium]|nr:hypothetical protein [Chloroflexota bacterium]